MTRNWLRLFGVVLGAVFTLAAQPAIKVPAAQEALLKQRVAKFWQPFVDAKFRLSDAYVSESAKDDFYSWPKRRIRSFAVDKIFYADAGKAAKVVTLVDVNMALMGVGAMDVKQPVETWWRLEKGTWFWFQPKNETRMTPFGTMETNAASGEAPLMPTGQFQRAPDLETLLAMVKPDRTAIHFTMGEAKEEQILIKSIMPGSVNLTLDTPPTQDFTFEISPKVIPREGTANLIVRYKPTAKLASDAEPVVKLLRLGIAQTGKVYDIKVFVDLKK